MTRTSSRCWASHWSNRRSVAAEGKGASRPSLVVCPLLLRTRQGLGGASKLMLLLLLLKLLLPLELLLLLRLLKLLLLLQLPL